MQSPFYLISGCNTSDTYIVDFSDVDAPSIGSVYYLTFTAETPAGCYNVVSTDAGPDVDTVNTISSPYTDCDSCLAEPTPTPTPTVTATPNVTPTNTPTQTSSPTPSPSPWPISGYSRDNQYAYDSECCNELSGSTGPNTPYPHPIDTNAYGVPYVQLNAVVIGGVNGLNN